MIPTRIGGYEIVGELGRGAMGVVYHGQDAAIGRPVAIKVIRVEAGTTEEESALLRQRLIREASAAGKLYHPSIVMVHQLGEDGNSVFIVMEYVEGSSLERLLINNPAIDRNRALDILAQVAVGLDYAHRAGVVHRDIKPANILVRSDERVKIADFGIAKLTSGTTTGMTATGMSIGSPAYMSPEQIQATEVDGQSDQFALAVIAFQMLTGRMPFRGDTAVTLMFQIVTGDPFDPQSGDIPVSQQMRAVLARALAKKPQDRFPDCASFIQELTDAAGAAAALSNAETVREIESLPAPVPQESKGWMVGPILGAVVTLGLLGAVGYYTLSSMASKPVPVAPVQVAEATKPPTPTPAPTATPAPTTRPAPSPAPAAAKKPAPAPSMTLMAAVVSGKVDVVKSLLAHHANVNEADADGNTPLMLAAEGTPNLSYNLPVVQMLIDARANLEARDSRGRTALHRAAAQGQASVVRVLLESGALIEARANDGSTALYQAVAFGKMAVVQLLLERKAQVDAADTSETTPLMIASEGNAYLAISAPMVEALLAAHARVNTADAGGRTALYRAAGAPASRPEVVRLLLDHGAKPNLAAKDGSTPLIEAVTFGRALVVQALLNHRADIDQADGLGETPLMIAATKSRHIKDPAKLIKLLLDKGAKRGLKDSKGHTALDRAKESRNATAAELLK